MNYFKLFLLGLMNITLLLSANAQTISPTESTIQHKDAQRPCLSVVVDPTEDELEDAWEDFLKDNYKIKLGGAGFLGMGNLLVDEEVIVPAISGKTMDFYTNIKKTEDGTEMKVFAAFGYDVYVDPVEMPAEHKAIKTMMTKFLSEYLPEYFREKVEISEKRVKKLTKAGEKLEKKQKKYAEKIEDLKKDIEETEKALEENQTANATESALLKERKAKLERILQEISRQ